MNYKTLREKISRQKFVKYVLLAFLLVFGSFLVLLNSCKNKHLDKIIYIDSGVTKNYLVKISNGYILIDTSNNNLYNKFIKNLKKLKIDLSEIKYCFLTHHHCDHSGFLAQLMENSNIEIITHKNSIRYLSSGTHENKMKPLNFCTHFAIKLFNLLKEDKKQKFPPVNLRLKDYMVSGDDNELLRSMGIEGQILYTPGHTGDSITLLLDDGRAFVGDLSMNVLSICRTNYRPIFANNMTVVFKSWDKLIKKGAKIIYPSHGDPFDVGHLVAALKKYKKDGKRLKGVW